MKLKTKNLWMMVVYLIIISTAIHSQEQPQSSDFRYGVFSHLGSSWNYQNAKAYLDSAGFNYIIDNIIPDTTTPLNQNLIGIKESSPQDYIGYYSKGYYSKWEAERNEFVFGRVGFKHPHKDSRPPYLYGQVETFRQVSCWATQRDIGHRVDSVLWGPHYHQDKRYDYGFWDPDPKITYIASYRMAFSNIPQKSQDDEVCKMKVTYNYRYGVFPDTHIVVIPITEKMLRVGDFPSDSSFRNFTISYQLPDGYKVKDRRAPENMGASTDTLYEDDVVLSGIEFKLEWSGIGKLYIDYVEVYDSLVWGNGFKTDDITTAQTILDIKTFAQNHSQIPKLNYWYVNDEPNSIDTYLPMRIVDSLVNTVTPGKNTITEIYPHWRGEFNGEHHLKQFVQLSNTKQLMIDHYPAYTGQPYWEGLEYLQNSLQWAWEAQPDFWYVAQAFGMRLNDGTYCFWRRPTPVELNTSLLLALSHGVKGIMFWLYHPNKSSSSAAECNDQSVNFNALLDSADTPTELYNYLRYDFTPRIKGKLGNTLLKLKYTGNSIRRRYIPPNPIEAEEPESFEYFTIGLNDFRIIKNWHAGFLEDSINTDNKYFLLVNLWTDDPKSAGIALTKPVAGFNNYRFRNVEPQYNFDTTYQNTFTTTLNFPAGEGYLYQVAPVVKYGGKLAFNDTIKSNTTLYEDMRIKNNVKLIIDRRKYYTITDTVTLEGTGFITGPGYLNVEQNGAVNINSWTQSVFKGRQVNNPKII